jgi:hypothetical protein
MSCCEGREAGEHQDGAEEKREDLPRCAGVGEALLDEIEVLNRKACACDLMAVHAKDNGHTKDEERLKTKAGVYRSVYHDLKRLLPKPESEARNERSGRRNTPAHQPNGSDAAPCSTNNTNQD